MAEAALSAKFANSASAAAELSPVLPYCRQAAKGVGSISASERISTTCSAFCGAPRGGTDALDLLLALEARELPGPEDKEPGPR